MIWLTEPKKMSARGISTLLQQSSFYSLQSKFKVINSLTKLRIDLHFGMSYCEGIEVFRITTGQYLVRQRSNTDPHQGCISSLRGSEGRPGQNAQEDCLQGQGRVPTFLDYVWSLEFQKSYFLWATNFYKSYTLSK